MSDRDNGPRGGIPYDERKTAYEQDYEILKPNIQHGVEGHTGYKCALCAAESHNPMHAYAFDSRADRHQNALIKWGEECDGIQTQFQKDSEAHWTEHQPNNPKCDCPKIQPMPPKPELDLERFDKNPAMNTPRNDPTDQ